MGCQNEKKYFFFGVASLLILVCCKFTLKSCPECDTGKFILAIYPWNLEYLVYAGYKNVFDTFHISMTVGEFRWKEQGGKIRRLLPMLDTNLLSKEHPNYYHGDKGSYLFGLSSIGVDTILSSTFKTQNFKYGTNSKLLFFRELRAGVRCFPKESGTNDTLDEDCPNIPKIFPVKNIVFMTQMNL